MRPRLTTRDKRTVKPCLNWHSTIDEVCARHDACRKDVLSGWKSPKAVAARHEIFWRLNQRGVALNEIGRRLGGFHHTTVMHGVRLWQARVDSGTAVQAGAA